MKTSWNRPLLNKEMMFETWSSIICAEIRQLSTSTVGEESLWSHKYNFVSSKIIINYEAPCCAILGHATHRRHWGVYNNTLISNINYMYVINVIKPDIIRLKRWANCSLTTHQLTKASSNFYRTTFALSVFLSAAQPMGRPHSPQSGENDDGDGLFVTRLHFTVSPHVDRLSASK